LQSIVKGNEGRCHIEDLLAEASPRVEDGVVASTGEWVLSVRAYAVRDDALLLDGACSGVVPLAVILVAAAASGRIQRRNMLGV